jgi:hypothetical protein
MALSSTLVWEVRTTGSPTNGGGFRAGATGTDWSQQAAPQYSVTDAVANGTTTVTSATANFGTDVVGNVANIGGGWYEITARNSATSITVDRTIGIASGLTLKIGGALDHPATVAGVAVTSNKIFIRAGTYTTTATITFAQSPGAPASAVPAFRLIGYNASRTDKGAGGRPLVQLSTNTGLTGISCTGSGVIVENIAVDCASLGTSTGIGISFNSIVRNCKVQGFTSKGINLVNGHSVAQGNEVTGGTAAASSAISGNPNPASYIGNWVHDNACTGISPAGTCFIAFNVLSNNTGAASDGIFIPSTGSWIFNNTIYNSGRHGINYSTNDLMVPVLLLNNLLSENKGFGILGAPAPGDPADPIWDGNAFFSNTSGARSNMDDAGAVNPQNGVAAYVRVLDVILTADPFTNKATNDYSLNNTAGGGAAIRAHSAFPSWPGLSVVGSGDMGAIQHQEAAGGGLIYFPGMMGGMPG